VREGTNCPEPFDFTYKIYVYQAKYPEKVKLELKILFDIIYPSGGDAI